MARLLVIGALAWDIPVRLRGPIARGVRVTGVRGPGRLGGGGANAGVALRAAGHEVAIGAYLPEDGASVPIRAAARQAGLRLDLVRAIEAPTSGTTLLLIEPDGERAILTLHDEGAPPAPLETTISTDDWRGFGAHGLYVRSPYPGAVETAAAMRGPVVAHWSPNAGRFDADVAIGSRDDLGPLDDPFAAARARFGPRLASAVITDGARGAIAYGADGNLTHQPALPARVVDTTGAGDVFAAGVLDALVAGATLPAAMAHGAVWAKLAVETEGSAPIDVAFRPFPLS